MKGIRKLAPYLRPYYKTIAVMVILGVFSSLADSIYPLFTSYALDTFVAGKTLRGIVPFSLLYLLLSFSYFNQNNVGYIHARVMSDTGKIGELVAWRLMDFVWEASYILFVIVMMLAINVRLAAWTLLIVPAGVLIITYFQRRLVEGNRKIREINSTITGNFNEGITGARSIRTLVIEKLMQRDFEKDTTRMRKDALFGSVHLGRDDALFVRACGRPLAWRKDYDAGRHPTWNLERFHVLRGRNARAGPERHPDTGGFHLDSGEYRTLYKAS